MNSTIKNWTASLTTLGISAFPLLASAQTSINVQDPGIQTFLQDVFNVVAPILITLVILYILYGAFLFATGGEESRDQGKDILLYGAIGLIIIASLLGLISLVLGTVSVSGTPNTDVQGFN